MLHSADSAPLMEHTSDAVLLDDAEFGQDLGESADMEADQSALNEVGAMASYTATKKKALKKQIKKMPAKAQKKAAKKALKKKLKKKKKKLKKAKKAKKKSGKEEDTDENDLGESDSIDEDTGNHDATTASIIAFHKLIDSSGGDEDLAERASMFKNLVESEQLEKRGLAKSSLVN